MAADPEGIVWFRKDALKCASFNPHDKKTFWEKMMIEVLVDKPLPIGLSNGQVEAHDRAHLLEENGNPRWRELNIMYGKKPTAMTRLFQLEKKHPDTTQNPQAKFVFIPMPTKDERYLWLELTWAVRGIYLPVCQQAMGAFKDWCKYLRLDFKARTLKYDIPYGLPYDQEAIKEFNKLQKLEQDSAGVKGAQAPTQAQLKKAHSSPNAGFWDAPSFFPWKFRKENYESGERLYRTGIQYDKTYPDQVHGMLQYDQGGGWLFTGDDDTSNSGLYDAEKAQAGMINPPTIKSDVAGKVSSLRHISLGWKFLSCGSTSVKRFIHGSVANIGQPRSPIQMPCSEVSST